MTSCLILNNGIIVVKQTWKRNFFLKAINYTISKWKEIVDDFNLCSMMVHKPFIAMMSLRFCSADNNFLLNKMEKYIIINYFIPSSKNFHFR